MNSIEVTRETLKIIKEKRYNLDGEEINFPDVDFEEVTVITPEDGEKLCGVDLASYEDKAYKISVVNADSFQAGREFDNPLVMNFANAHKAGGGFMLGANAQEESLCKCSTLYASISSKKAATMYRYNNTHISREESDYMLISPNVIVFRDEKFQLVKKPTIMSVITAPAPNRYGAAVFMREDNIKKIFLRRIRILLCAAASHGYKNLVLGAWGCGAFGNKAENVAEYFRSIIVDEGYGKCFDEICFAIHGEENGENITSFRKVFQDILISE